MWLAWLTDVHFTGAEIMPLSATLFFHRFGQLHLFAIGLDERGTAEDYSLGRGGVGCYLLPGMNPEKESTR